MGYHHSLQHQSKCISGLHTQFIPLSDVNGSVVSVLDHCVCRHRLDIERGQWFL